jgi:O-antigen ligase
MVKNRLTTSSPDRYGFNEMRPLTVHNGFLAAGMKYGILGMIVFTLFIGSLLVFSIRHARRGDRVTLVPVYAMVVWTLSNISNSANSFRMYFVLLVALLCGACVGQLAKRVRETSNRDGAFRAVPTTPATTTK